MSVDIKSTVKEQPELPFSVMTEKVLGPDYELSLVFNSPEEMQQLNKQYRQKEYVADILSFPLTETSGEIFMCLDQIRIKAAEYNQPFERIGSWE
ncbi:MAG TPA: rRNA maturation RNase YbeY [Candidatus Nanoarchaeia archaeon]|nr:rRNA maturation RNase YbeY [Candidatus Nanoarchaeia archaeon]